MPSANPDKPKDTICACSGTTQVQIRTLLANGANSLDRISRITGALSGCGGCEADIVALLREYELSGSRESL